MTHSSPQNNDLDRRTVPSRRSTDNSNDPLYLRVIKTLGITGTIAVGLTYFVTQGITQKINNIWDEQNKVASALLVWERDQQTEHDAMSASMKFHDAATQKNLETIALILRQICVNSAGNNTVSRGECFKASQQ